MNQQDQPSVASLPNRESEIFNSVLERATSAERAAYLDGACGDDAVSTNRTFSMLVNHVYQPPNHVQINSPNYGDNSPPGSSITVIAQALEPDSDLDHVEFFHEGLTVGGPNQSLGIASNAPYSVTWTNPTPGTYTLYAVAYDKTSYSATSPPVNLTVSVPVFYPPQLFVATLSNSIEVVWLDSISSNALQSATNLVPPVVWSPVTNPPQASDGAWFYFVSPDEPRRFFRLAY